MFYIWFHIACKVPSIRSKMLLSNAGLVVQQSVSSHPKQTMLLLLLYRELHLLRGQPPIKTKDSYRLVNKALRAFADRLPVGINHAY